MEKAVDIDFFVVEVVINEEDTDLFWYADKGESLQT
ncbi:MAG: hypothetical protein ACI9LE_001515 [Paraglaciecola sp.]